MIQKGSYLVPADRCGVWWVKTFHLYYGWNRKVSTVGNFLKTSVKVTRTNNKLKSKTKVVGVIIRTKKEILKKDRSWINFKKNSIILLKKRMSAKGKELSGPVSRKIKRKKFTAAFPAII